MARAFFYQRRQGQKNDTDLGKVRRRERRKIFHDFIHRPFGGQRAKLVPARAIADMQEDGAGFAGFATWLDLTPAHPDMLAVPDPECRDHPAVEQEIAWVPANCVMEGEDCRASPAQRAAQAD